MNLRSLLTVLAVVTTAFFLPSPTRAQDNDAKTAAMLKSENLGGLKLGLGEKDVVKQLGKPEKQGKLTEQAADGTFVQEWAYPSKGLTLTMTTGAKKTGAKTIASFAATAGNKLATAKGITIGSPVTAVRKAYGAFENKEEGNREQFVAGSIYGGILFFLEDGKVSRIFFGAAAE